MSEISASEVTYESPVIETPNPRMSWADMAQEDEFGEEEQELDKLGANSDLSEVTSAKVSEKPKLSREQREYIRFMNVRRKKDFICFERVNGKLVNILEGLELHTGIFSAAEQKRIVNFVASLQEMGRKGELKGLLPHYACALHVFLLVCVIRICVVLSLTNEAKGLSSD